MVYYDYFSPKNGIVGFFLNLIWFSLIDGMDLEIFSPGISRTCSPKVFAEAGDPLLMALFQGDGDGARRLPCRRCY